MSVDCLFENISAKPKTAQLDTEAPCRWMMDAWSDLAAAPVVSLIWGTIFSGLGLGLSACLQSLGLGSMIPAAMAAFFLVAPFLSVGMMDVARRQQANEPVSFRLTLSAWRRNPPGLWGIGLSLSLAMTAWLQIALLTFSLFFHQNPPDLDNFILSLLASDNAAPFLVTGSILGGVLAASVFALSALSVPMMLERDISVVEAMALSAAFVWHNRRVMLAWGAIITVLIAFGFLTFFLGLVLTLPLISYGSWHLYEEFKSLS